MYLFDFLNYVAFSRLTTFKMLIDVTQHPRTSWLSCNVRGDSTLEYNLKREEVFTSPVGLLAEVRERSLASFSRFVLPRLKSSPPQLLLSE